MAKTDAWWNVNQSVTVDWLRFPMVFCVLFIHIGPDTMCFLDADYLFFSAQGLCNAVFITLSQVVSRVAVPFFFFTSGFFFFSNLQVWSWKGYALKIRKRIRTLAVPYLSWNLLAFCIPLIKKVLGTLIHSKSWNSVILYLQTWNWRMLIDSRVFDRTRVNILGLANYGTAPIVLPLWFLRDLMIVSLLSPIIYWMVKNNRHWGIALLFVFFVTRIWILLPGFSISAIFFFSLGAYLSVNGLNIARVARKWAYLSIPLSILLFVPCLIYDGFQTITGDNLMPFYIISTLFSFIAIASVCVERYCLTPNKFLTHSSFFVYAAHTVSIFIWWTPMQLAKKVLQLMLPENGALASLINYLLIPFITLALCLFAYFVLVRCFPRVASVLCGGRSQFRSK